MARTLVLFVRRADRAIDRSQCLLHSKAIVFAAGLHKGHVRLELFDLKKTNFLAAHEVTHSLRRADRTGVSHHCGTVALRQKPHQTTQLCAISPVSRGGADTVELHVCMLYGACCTVQTPLSCMALNLEGTRLATASEKAREPSREASSCRVALPAVDVLQLIPFKAHRMRITACCRMQPYGSSTAHKSR